MIQAPTTQAVVWLCPQCGSPSIQRSDLALLTDSKLELQARCSTCSWSGPQKELVAAPFQHQLGTDAEIAERMARDLRNMMAKIAGPVFGSFLVKYGFMQLPLSVDELRYYLTKLAPVILQAMIAARQELQAKGPPPEKPS